MEILPPTKCPSCGARLEQVNSQLFCRNKIDCPAQSTKRLQHFCKVLKIKGFGEKTVEKLEISQLSDLLNLTEEYCKEKGFGDKTATNLTTEVSERLRRKIPVREFIAGMSIPLVGTTLASKLESLHPDNYSYEVLKELGAGEKAALNILEWQESEWKAILKPLWASYLTIEDTIKPKTERGDVCITGKLTDFPNRTEAAKYLATLGWTVKNSVTKTVQYLICEDDSKINSSSYKKAKANGIEILTIKDLEDK